MMYILDTNIFREFLSHIPRKGKRLEELWDLFEGKIDEGEFLSVDECYNELMNHYSKDAEHYKWIHAHKDMFKNPTDQESCVISELLKNPKMQESIHQKNILQNRPAADLYIAAKAKVLGGTVVTCEKYKPHSAQLPNLCEELQVPVISYEEFMEMLG